MDNIVRLVPRDDHVKQEKTSSADPNKTGVRKKVDLRSVDGFAFTLCSYAKNQHYSNDISQKRLGDLSRVVTILPASGIEDTEEANIQSFSEVIIAVFAVVRRVQIFSLRVLQRWCD